MTSLACLQADSAFGRKPSSPQWANSANQGEDQLARSRRLNSEGLEVRTPLKLATSATQCKSGRAGRRTCGFKVGLPDRRRRDFPLFCGARPWKNVPGFAASPWRWESPLDSSHKAVLACSCRRPPPQGLIPRGTELIKLGVGSVLAFWPFIAGIAIVFTLTFKLFGSDFLHDGEIYRYKATPYMVPEGLLAEPTVDKFVAF